ncbi:hypothetical protein GTQ40_17345 [Flavobacteriaceae bacterium R38]|nr:hypothetical protein [Flavobacteriaceae bacterium R38]
MKRVVNIFLILIPILSYAQSNPESEIFQKVIDYEISKEASGIFIRCKKPKTFFNQTDFIEQTGLEVPKSVLNEIEKNAKMSTHGVWNSELIQEMSYHADFIKEKECLTSKDIEKLFERTGKRQSVISLSQPIFDSKFENCVVSVTYLKFTGSAYGQKYFLKKVYGVWVVIMEYDFWMT